MTLTAEWINRFEQFGKVTYDLLLKDGNTIKHRFNIKFDSENDTEEYRNNLVADKLNYVDIVNRAVFVNSKIDILKSRLLAGLELQLEALRAEILKELYGGLG